MSSSSSPSLEDLSPDYSTLLYGSLIAIIAGFSTGFCGFGGGILYQLLWYFGKFLYLFPTVGNLHVSVGIININTFIGVSTLTWETIRKGMNGHKEEEEKRGKSNDSDNIENEDSMDISSTIQPSLSLSPSPLDDLVDYSSILFLFPGLFLFSFLGVLLLSKIAPTELRKWLGLFFLVLSIYQIGKRLIQWNSSIEEKMKMMNNHSLLDRKEEEEEEIVIENIEIPGNHSSTAIENKEKKNPHHSLHREEGKEISRHSSSSIIPGQEEKKIEENSSSIENHEIPIQSTMESIFNKNIEKSEQFLETMEFHGENHPAILPSSSEAVMATKDSATIELPSSSSSPVFVSPVKNDCIGKPWELFIQLWRHFRSSQLYSTPYFYSGLLSGAFGGLLDGAYGCGGPPVIIYFTHFTPHLSSTQIRNSYAIVSFLIYPSLLLLSILYEIYQIQYISLYCIIPLFSLLGNRIGSYYHPQMNHSWFLLILQGLIFFSSIPLCQPRIGGLGGDQWFSILIFYVYMIFIALFIGFLIRTGIKTSYFSRMLKSSAIK